MMLSISKVKTERGWKLVPLKRVARFGYGEALAAEERDAGGSIKVYGSNGAFARHSAANTLAPCLIIGRKGSYGKVQFSKEPVFAVDTTFVVDRRYTENDLRFLYYMISVLGLDALSDDTAVPGLSREKAYAALCPIPPLTDQRRVVAFLDKKTAQIDTLIAKKQVLLERLAEKRQAILTQAVTKGLMPNAPMKESGVDWLGEVPAHWKLCGLGQMIKLQRGVDITKDQRIEGSIPVVSSGGVEYHHSTALCSGPGVLIGRKGAAGKLHYIDTDYWPHDTTLYVREFRGNNPRFCWYLLHCLDLTSFDTGSANPTVNRNRIHPIKTAWPPADEQRAISSFLDIECERQGKIASQIEASCEKLFEYRSALVTAAVTGQIDELR